MSDQTSDKAMRAFAKAVFARADDTEPDEPEQKQKPLGNFVPREGNNPQPAPDHDAEMREFTRELFGFDPA